MQDCSTLCSDARKKRGNENVVTVPETRHIDTRRKDTVTALLAEDQHRSTHTAFSFSPDPLPACHQTLHSAHLPVEGLKGPTEDERALRAALLALVLLRTLLTAAPACTEVASERARALLARLPASARLAARGLLYPSDDGIPAAAPPAAAPPAAPTSADGVEGMPLMPWP